jgi:DNA-directed RNA polymerase subunit RPC12/RpoP
MNNDIIILHQWYNSFRFGDDIVIAVNCTGCGSNEVRLDSSNKLAVCEHCDTKLFLTPEHLGALNSSDSAETVSGGSFSPGQTVFALWESDGYYYPATIGKISGDIIEANYLDGHNLKVHISSVISLDEGFNILNLEGNWKNRGLFYGGIISNRESMLMNYHDGDKERVQLVQLRGSRPV